jgi:hypothetical protein
MAQIGEDGGCHWTRCKNPADVVEPWGTVVPESLELDYKTYIGAVEIDYPPTLQIDTEVPEQGGEKTTYQHFINVRADVNSDAGIDSNDDDDTAEESGDGLIVNHGGNAEAGGPENLQAIQLQFSQPPPAMGDSIAGYELWITNGAEEMSQLFFWKDAQGTQPIPLEPEDEGDPESPKAWKTTIGTFGGNDMTIYVGAKSSEWQAGLVSFFLVAPRDTENGETGDCRISMDRIRISKANLGIAVDSDNDGTIGPADDQVEEEKVHFLPTGIEDQVQVRGYRFLDLFPSPVVTLESSVAGRASVKTASGSVRLPAAPTSVSEYTWTSGTIGEVNSDVTTSYVLEGWATGSPPYGDVTLSVQVAYGLTVLAYDWCMCAVVKVDMILEGVENDDAKEDDPGGMVPLNADNDNESNPVDKTNGWIPTNRDYEVNPIEKENDTKKLTLDPSGAAVEGISFKLRVDHAGEARVKIWVADGAASGKQKGKELTLPATWATAVDVPAEVWVEGFKNGADLRDVSLAFEALQQGQVVTDDKIKVTVGPVVIFHKLENPGDPSLTTVAGWIAARIDMASKGYFADCPGTLAYVQIIELHAMTLTYTAASGRPQVTLHHCHEPSTDQNGNGVWDAGEPYEDWDGSGAYTTEFGNPLLDAATNPPPAGQYAANVFYLQQQLTDVQDGDHRTKNDNDGPSVRWNNLPNLADAEALAGEFRYKLYLVWKHPERGTFFPLAERPWTVNWHTTFAAGSATIGANADTTSGTLTLNPAAPAPLISPVFNMAQNSTLGAGWR